MTYFIIIFTLLQWSGTKPTVSLRNTCICLGRTYHPSSISFKYIMGQAVRLGQDTQTLLLTYHMVKLNSDTGLENRLGFCTFCIFFSLFYMNLFYSIHIAQLSKSLHFHYNWAIHAAVTPQSNHQVVSDLMCITPTWMTFIFIPQTLRGLEEMSLSSLFLHE